MDIALKGNMEKENISYVNAVIFSEDGKKLVFLKKLSGPPFLIGKYNFVGGKAETGENNIQAVLREVKEESNLNIQENMVESIDYREFEKEGNFYRLENFVAVVPLNRLNDAKTMEKEPIYVMSFVDLFEMIKSDRQSFNYDFCGLLDLALNAVMSSTKLSSDKSQFQKILNEFNLTCLK